MIGANKKKSDFATPYTVSNALTKGGAAVKLSALIMGLGNIAHKQIIKGLIFLAIEIGYIMFMVNAGAYYLSMLPMQQMPSLLTFPPICNALEFPD